MATTGNRFVIQQMKRTANMTEHNNLTSSLIAQPHMLSGIMEEVFSARNLYASNPISSMLIGSPMTQETITAPDWTWNLKGATTRPLVCLGNIEPVTNTALGKYGTSFKIKLDENWYVPGDYIHPGTSDKRNQLRVSKAAVQHGDGWIYEVVLASGQPEDSFDPKYLVYGQQFGKLFSKYGEAANQSGSTQFSFPMKLKNDMSLIRKTYQITNLAHDEVLAVSMPGKNGKMVDSWFEYAQVEFWLQYYRERERLLHYSRSSDTVLDSTGRPVLSGAGLQEQLEDSHKEYYSVLTARLLEEYLMDIFYSRTKPGIGRKVIALTGEYGMIQFNRAITDFMNKSGFIKNVEFFNSKVSSPYNPRSISVGFQVAEYVMANGASLTLMHNPIYDDRDVNFEPDPITGFPVESQRFTFLDFANGEGGPNIKLMKKENSFRFKYIPGLLSPEGMGDTKFAAHSGSYYDMHVEEMCGLHIHDITRCGELVLRRNG